MCVGFASFIVGVLSHARNATRSIRLNTTRTRARERHGAGSNKVQDAVDNRKRLSVTCFSRLVAVDSAVTERRRTSF